MDIDEFIGFRTVIQGYNRPHLEYCCKHAIEGHALEFGVASGSTINCIAKALPERTIYGFDSFEGLPEAWQKTDRDRSQKGRFARGDMPHVRDNVTLIVGLFEDTISRWKATHQGQVALIHVDCDLYSSTRDVLFGMDDRIVPGTIVVFDEIYNFGKPSNYSRWAEGEFKALNEWLEKCNRRCEVFSRTNSWCAAIRVRT